MLTFNEKTGAAVETRKIKVGGNESGRFQPRPRDAKRLRNPPSPGKRTRKD